MELEQLVRVSAEGLLAELLDGGDLLLDGGDLLLDCGDRAQ
ncbi:hypothetical protein [Nonomuraea rhodomycinica]|nr:hypothetical protein [Nonomuraea rhodomycinica]